MKYSRDQLPCGAILNFMPLVYEHFGSWGAKASEYLQQLFKKTNIYGTWNRSQLFVLLESSVWDHPSAVQHPSYLEKSQAVHQLKPWE